jgi:hypothetical protein
MVETNQLEGYITRTFSKITDDFGRPLNITLAVPVLFAIISGNTEAYTNHVNKQVSLFVLFFY